MANGVLQSTALIRSEFKQRWFWGIKSIANKKRQRSIAERYEDEARRIRGDHGKDDSP